MFTPLPLPFQANRLLAALPSDEYQRIFPSLERLTLKIRDGLYEPNETIEYVYFPLSGMASILVSSGDHTLTEAGIVGNEGIVGLTVFLGAETTTTKSFYQIAGEVARMPSDAFRAELKRNGMLVTLLQRYALAYFALLAQNSVCNGQHGIGQRCARWLLMSYDRARGNQFELTQEFLSQMLGVRRAGVSKVMNSLQEANIVHYSRGFLTIVDRTGLEHAACECYGIIKNEYQHLLDV